MLGPGGIMLMAGFQVQPMYIQFGEMLLNMLLRGVESRPIIDRVRGRLEFEYERRYEPDWEYDR